MQKISRRFKFQAFALLLTAGMVSACASSEVSENAPSLEVSEAALLDDTERATPVLDDSAVFADLNAAPADSNGAGAATVSDASASEMPFYNPIGGESLARVAYTLYGDRSRANLLLEQNPSLRGVKSLGTDQRVFFDFSQLRPMPTYLTKDLLDRYPAELAEKVAQAGLAKETVSLAPGETLQQLSQRLYGTTRYWTEIFLLNRENIRDYDRVPAGISVVVFQRQPVATAPQSQEPSTAYQPQAQEEQPAAQVPTQPVMPVEPSAIQPEAVGSAPTPEQNPAVEPIPETPTAVAPPAVEENYVPQAPATAIDSSFFSDTSNMRRALYGGLIVLIGLLAFLFTRSQKKKNFDMLDVTTNDTESARSRFPNKDNQKQDIG